MAVERTLDLLVEARLQVIIVNELLVAHFFLASAAYHLRLHQLILQYPMLPLSRHRIDLARGTRIVGCFPNLNALPAETDITISALNCIVKSLRAYQLALQVLNTAT